jgi:prepilin signal peptidase PulO-like enzyme (type II secretory pathway)
VLVSTKIFLFAVGLIISSFVQLLVDRDNSPSAFFDRSRCDNCKKELPWYALIPILGALITRFKCVYCNKKFSVRYLLFEVIFALFWGVTLFLTEFSLPGILSVLLFLSICMYLAYYDYLRHEVPVIALLSIIIPIPLMYFYQKPLLYDWMSALYMFGIILVSVIFVKLRRAEKQLFEIFGPADWFVLIVSAFVLGIQATTVILVISTVLMIIFLAFQAAVLKVKNSEGVPFLTLFLPVFYVFVMYYLATTVIYL